MLENKAGVVLGRLFERNAGHDTSGPVFDPVFDDGETERVVRSRGRRLVERYWGHYVAFLQSGDGQEQYVLRDPTGGLPCFRLDAGGIEVIVSDMEDYVRLDLARFSINWQHVTAFFHHVRLVTEATGFNEVAQLNAGECLAIANNGKTRSSYWDPVAVCKANVIEDPERARSSLRDEIQACINAWASCYQGVVLELSGGLDSSVVAACLAKANSSPKVLCVNFYSEDAEGDERPFARAAARRTGFGLVESQLDATGESLEGQLDKSRLPTPAVLGLVGKATSHRARLVADERAGAVFTGRGGDQLFQHDNGDHVAAEFAHRHGLRPKLFEIIVDTARATRRSIWSVLAAALRDGVFKRAHDPYAEFETPPILTDTAEAALESGAYRHAWVDGAAGLPASKIRQIFHVVDCQPFHQLPYPYAELVHPLVSQPVIERCLQVPGYVLARRGVGRALLREAFGDDLPAEIANRQSKGGTTTHLIRTMLANRTFMREFLLDGTLVREGILDRAALEKRLSERALVLGVDTASILKATRAEAWLRNWADVDRHTAA